MKLVLETKDQPNKTVRLGNVGSLTPPIDETYWLARVAISKNNAVVCFPKFSAIGIGFQVEKADWNSNLPYNCPTMEIYDHISANAGRGAKPSDIIKAIQMLREWAANKLGKVLADEEARMKG